MFTFHQIAKQAEGFLTSDEDRLKDFRSRLQYLARGVQGYIKKLKEFLASSGTKAVKDGEEDDVKIKQIALRTNENIQAMIRDLFHSPPIYKASITLSFKANNTKTNTQAKVGDKRKPITFSGGRSGVSNYKPGGKVSRPSGQYNVPQGKYSSKIN